MKSSRDSILNHIASQEGHSLAADRRNQKYKRNRCHYTTHFSWSFSWLLSFLCFVFFSKINLIRFYLFFLYIFIYLFIIIVILFYIYQRRKFIQFLKYISISFLSVFNLILFLIELHY